ncbi:MAG: hypothetical protein N2Z80_07510 [Hydrogenothermaceae bacterium]|nr:hypothetical protein [Hydrogenothermaceae bacterium]
MSIIYIQQVGRISPEDVEGLFDNQEEKKMKTVVEFWIEKGLKKGIEQRLQQGLQQRLKEGLLKEERDVIKLYIQAKLRHLPEWVESEVNKIDDVDELNSLFRELIMVDDVEGFLRVYFLKEGAKE